MGSEDRALRGRWKVLLGGFLLSLMGGVAYAWGVFVVPMMERFGWSRYGATLPFTFFMLVFAFFMVPAGHWQDKKGPNKVAPVGAILFLIAYILSGLVDRFPNPWWLVLSYGFLGGLACALTYSCVAPVARKWFPDKPGLAVSLAVMGFGLAAIFFAPLKARFLIPAYGIESTFLIIGILTSGISLLASRLLKNPPQNWSFYEQCLQSGQCKTVEVRAELAPSQVVGKRLFWELWFVFFLVSTGGFVSLSLISSYGQEVLGLNPLFASLAISVFAGVNGLGRPLAGYLGDRFGILFTMIGAYVLQGLTLVLFGELVLSQVRLYVASAMVGFGYAVNLALFPTLVALCFGIKHLGANYGLVFTAFGVAALVSGIGSWMFDLTGSFTPAFVFSGLMALLGAGLSFLVKKAYRLY